jgi:hypothetical protein
MTASVIQFGEVTASMTFAEGLSFVERTRRQLDRSGELPGDNMTFIPADEAREIRRLCDELEADIKAKLSNI